MEATIRLATEADAEQILGIYAPHCTGSAATFEVEPPSLGEMERRIGDLLIRHPWLVCVVGDRVLGYAYGSLHRTRSAYQWSAECSVYIHPDYQRRRIARGMYTALFSILTAQGYYTVFAGITLPNPSSVGLHEALGFEPVGIYRSIGYKLGAWHDVGWWQLALLPYISDPPLPIPLANLPRDGKWLAALRAGEALVRI